MYILYIFCTIKSIKLIISVQVVAIEEVTVAKVDYWVLIGADQHLEVAVKEVQWEG